MTSPDEWNELGVQVERLQNAIRKVTTVAINSSSLRESAMSAVQQYFRSARPIAVAVGMSDNELDSLDNNFQTLNELAQGRNRKKSFLHVLKGLRSEIISLSLRRHILVGTKANSAPFSHTEQQKKIILTLRGLLPSAANSFAQAIIDLVDLERFSYRGAAAELREALREVIDQLAPDDVVSSAAGFRYEKDQHGKDRTSPTMKQKVRFILKNRGKGTTTVATAEDALARVESGPDNLARSLYNRGSAATHTSRERQEVLMIARYTEVMLAELLEID